MSPVQVTLSSECTRMTVLMQRTPTQPHRFTACPRTGVLRSSDDTLCHVAQPNVVGSMLPAAFSLLPDM